MNGAVAQLRAEFEERGWTIAKGLFSEEETARLRDHLTDLRAGPCSGDEHPFDADSPELAERCPRIVHLHLWDLPARGFMLDPRLHVLLAAFLDEEPVAVQTLASFKPPGSPGRPPHRDAPAADWRPGVSCTVWMALDPVDEENGGLALYSGSHLASGLVRPGDGFAEQEATLPHLAAGDVLFFDGALVHASTPNRSRVRWRRALIGRYVSASIGTFDSDLRIGWRFDGAQVELAGPEPEAGQVSGGVGGVVGAGRSGDRRPFAGSEGE